MQIYAAGTLPVEAKQLISLHFTEHSSTPSKSKIKQPEGSTCWWRYIGIGPHRAVFPTTLIYI